MQHHRLTIRGMHCQSCATKIRDALMRVEGVEAAEVSPGEGAASVTAREAVGRVGFDRRLRDAVASAGDYELVSVEPVERSPAPASAGAGSANAAAAESGVMGDEAESGESLYPLFLIVGFIAGVTVLIAAAGGDWSLMTMMRHFMAGFFLVFSFFKLLDIRGFVSAYRGYDLLARRSVGWAYAYPFVELALGVAYLLAVAPIATNAVTLVLMLVGAAGVLRALLDKRAIRCACLGTALNLPMTKVTLVEDLTMAGMAGGMLTLLLV